MKIAFPTQEDNGVESAVYSHFGTARSFIIVDTDTNETTVVNNRDLHHAHGQCRPMAALGGQNIDAVVVGGIGGGALRKLNDAGVTVYRAIEGTVAKNLVQVQAAALPQFTMNQTCAGHHGSDGCAHKVEEGHDHESENRLPGMHGRHPKDAHGCRLLE